MKIIARVDIRKKSSWQKKITLITITINKPGVPYLGPVDDYVLVYYRMFMKSDQNIK